MKQIILAFLLIVSLDAMAQVVKKKPVRKAAKVDSTKMVATESVVEEAPIMEEMVATVEAPVEDNSSRTFNDGNDLYYLSDTYSDKGVSIVYKGDYNNRLYAIIETATKKKLTPFIFESIRASFYSTNNTAIVTVNGKSGTINSKGQMILPCIYDALSSFTMDEQTYYIATFKSKVGIISETNEIILPFEYTRLEKTYRNKPNIFVAQKGELYGLVNIANKQIVVPIEYSSIGTDSDDYLRVAKDNQYTLIGWNGKQLFKNWYNYLTIYDDCAIAELNGLMGIIDLSEKKLLPFEYDKLERVSTNTDRVYNFIGRKNGKYGMCTVNGSVIIPFEYDQLAKGYLSFIRGTKNGLKGLLDLNGKVALPFEYSVVSIGDNAILLKKGDKYGLMNRDLSFILPMKYEYIKTITMNDSYSTYFMVKLDGKTGIYNSNGKMLLDVLYDDVLPYSPANRYRDTYKSPFIVVKKGKYGIVESNEDSDGKIIIPFEYDELDYINTYLVMAKKNGKYGIRTIYENTVVLPFEYQSLTNKGGSLVGYKGTFEQFTVYGKTVTPVSSK